MTSPDGPRILPFDAELPGDPMPLKRHLAQLRRERLRLEQEAGEASGRDPYEPPEEFR